MAYVYKRHMQGELRENRRHPRYKAKFEVSCASREFEGATKGHLADVSLSGAAINSSLAVNLGAEICICIRTEKDGTFIFIDLARVCWVGVETFGAEFISIGRHQATIYDRGFKS
jgi:hypothetical protein